MLAVWLAYLVTTLRMQTLAVFVVINDLTAIVIQDDILRIEYLKPLLTLIIRMGEPWYNLSSFLVCEHFALAVANLIEVRIFF